MPNRGAKVVDASMPTIDAMQRSGVQHTWGCSSIKWRMVIKYQDYVSLFLTIGFIIGLIIATNDQSTYQRPFLIYDATISFYYNGSSTVPYWVAIVVPLIMMLLSFAVGELVLARGWHGAITSAVASLVFFTVDGVSAFIVTGFATQVTKVAVGRLRPDFLARCNPGSEGSNAVINYGAAASSNPPCNPTVSEGELKDGHWSFPSGHTSTVFVFAVYASAYCLWAFYARVKQQPPVVQRGVGTSTPGASSSNAGWGAADGSGAVKAAGGGGWWARWARDLVSLGGFVWVLAMMAFAWGVGASRIVDNKHHPSDVVGGAFLGSGIALLYFFRAVPRHRRLDAVDEGDAEPAPVPLLGGEGGATPPAHAASSEMV